MKKELDDLLCAKYPKIFADRNKSMQETCMCWGMDCGRGWFNIIDKLCANIQWHIDQRAEQNERYRSRPWKTKAWWRISTALYHTLNLPGIRTMTKFIPYKYRPTPLFWKALPEIPQVVADQVKEKFGTLRFYYHGGDEEISGMVRMAEAMSSVTCDVCGNPGTTKGPGWIRTLCETHRKKESKEKFK